jgi:hypothetical protein
MRKGIWPFRSEWYSVCSAHQQHSRDCDTCQYGSWRNVVTGLISSTIFKHKPDLWRWWMNLTFNKKRWLDNIKHLRDHK